MSARPSPNDWAKHTWDLPTDVDQLAQLMPLEQLVTMACWQAAPDSVRREVAARMTKENRQ